MKQRHVFVLLHKKLACYSDVTSVIKHVQLLNIIDATLISVFTVLTFYSIIKFCLIVSLLHYFQYSVFGADNFVLSFSLSFSLC